MQYRGMTLMHSCPMFSTPGILEYTVLDLPQKLEFDCCPCLVFCCLQRHFTVHTVPVFIQEDEQNAGSNL